MSTVRPAMPDVEQADAAKTGALKVVLNGTAVPAQTKSKIAVKASA